MAGISVTGVLSRCISSANTEEVNELAMTDLYYQQNRSDAFHLTNPS